MHAPLFRTLFPRCRFAWLLWLALLLPVAQVAAASHALSHRGAVAGDVGYEGKRALTQQADCALCLAASAIGSAAPPATPTSWPQTSLTHERLQAFVECVALGPLLLAYSSRAPPSFQC